MAARRGPATRGKSEPQGQLAATTTSFGCSAGLSFMDVTKPQLFGVMSFISEMNAQPWLSAGFASQAATSSVTSADIVCGFCVVPLVEKASSHSPYGSKLDGRYYYTSPGTP